MGFKELNIIGTRFETEGEGQAVGGANRVASAYDRVAGSAGNAVRTMLGMATAVVSIGAATMGLNAMAAQYGSLEDSQRSLGAMVAAGMNPATPNRFAAAMAEARWLTSGLAEDAARLPGEYADFVNVAQSALGPMSAIGRDVRKVRADVGDLAIVSAILGMETRQTGMDFQRMLQGQAGLEQVLWRNLTGMQLIKMNAQAFNKLTPEQRYITLMNAVRQITGDQALIASVAGSWSTVSSTLKDNITGVQGMLGMIGQRTMPNVIEQTARLNGWFDANGKKTSGWADAIASNLNPAIQRAGELTLGLLNNTAAVRDTALAAAAAFGLMSAVSMVGGAAGVTALGARTRGIWSSAGGAAPALVRPDFMAMTAGLAMGSRALPAAAAGGAAVGLGPMLLGFGKWLWALVPGLAVLVPLVAGVAGIFITLKYNLLGLGDVLGNSFGMLGRQVATLGRTLLGVLMPVAATFGMLLTAGLIPVTWALTGLGKIIVWTIDMVGKLVTWVSSAVGAMSVGNFYGAIGVANKEASRFRFENLAADWQSEWMAGARAALGPGVANAGKGGKKDAFPYPGTQVNIQNLTLQMKLETNESPDRIAFRTLDSIARLAARTSTAAG